MVAIRLDVIKYIKWQHDTKNKTEKKLKNYKYFYHEKQIRLITRSLTREICCLVKKSHLQANFNVFMDKSYCF